MNYRHAFHAGGFADVIKHIVLVRMLAYLQEKPAAFRVIDTHAGAGVYDLTSEEARRGGEWLTGIARIMQARFSEKTEPLLKPYLDIVRAFNPQRDLVGLSGIAADRPRAAAAAGSPDRLRGRAESAQAPDRGAAARHPGPGGRPRRLDRAAGLRAAERAARPGPDRSAVRAEGRVRTAGRRLCRGLREMADRQLSAVVPGEKPARHRRPGAACRRGGRRQHRRLENACGWNSASRRRPPAPAWSPPGF